MAISSLSHSQADGATLRTVQFTPHRYAMWITTRGQRRMVGTHCMYSVALMDDDAAGQPAA